MRCAIYPRVSTDRQRERHTIDSQLRILPEYAEKQGWTVIDPRRYMDDGRSGEDVVGRPGMTKLLDDAAQGLFEVVLVIDLDRITRSRKSAEGALIFDQLREYGVKIATPSQGIIDLEDEDQDLLVQIKREVAKWEKRKIVRRMMRGKREAAKKGKRFGCLDPYGLRWVLDENDPRGGSYVIAEQEAVVVRRIFHLAVIEGLGKSMIAWRLNAEGHQTRDIKRGSRPNGGPGAWAATTVAKILRSTTYRGEFHVFKKDDGTKIQVPPIVDRETWERAQAAVRGRKSETKWKHDREYLLAGIARCGVCGYAMWAVNARPDRGVRYAYYRCSSSNAWRKLKMDCPCGNRHHRVDQVDEGTWHKFVQVLRDPDFLAEACSLNTESVGVDWTSQADGARKKLGDLEEHEGEILKLHRRGRVSVAALDRELGEIQRERKLAQRNLKLAEDQLTDAGARQRLVNDIQGQAQALASKLEAASFEQRRTLIRLLVPTEHGYFVKLMKDGSIEINALLPTETSTVELNVKVAAAKAS
jgi:site-specific DNA recombinase